MSGVLNKPLKRLAVKTQSLSLSGLRTEDRYRHAREVYQIDRECINDIESSRILGRLYDTYRDALDALPRDVLTIYAIAATHLAKYNPEKLRTLTSSLLEVLEDIKALLKNDARATIPPELRRKVLKIYRELIDIATEAVKG